MEAYNNLKRIAYAALVVAPLVACSDGGCATAKSNVKAAEYSASPDMKMVAEKSGLEGLLGEVFLRH